MNEILHVINLDTVGGVEELFVHFLKMAEGKHHILITGGRLHPHFKDQVQKNAASITYEKYFCGLKIPKFFSSIRQLKRKIAAKKSNISRIVLWNRIETISDLKKMASPKTTIIYYEHGASWIQPKKLRTTAFFSAVDALIANSQAAKRLLKLKWDINKPIAVIDNPLRPDLPIKESPKKAPLSPFQIGYIGRLIPLKAVSLLLHAVAILNARKIPVKLTIAGDGEEKAELEKEMHKLHLQGQITFVGIVDDVTSFYDSIDLLVVPSIREPLGLVALEASSRGCPVIATKVDGLPEVVQNGENGYLLEPTLSVNSYTQYGGRTEKLPDLVYNPTTDQLQEPQIIDPVHIADKIEYLIKHNDEYLKMSAAALVKARKRTNFETYTKQLLELIS
jgi:glycosyltransferase involved in cell wall biosynthesis